MKPLLNHFTYSFSRNITSPEAQDYQIEIENKDCLEIYFDLLEAFDKCEKYASRYLNLVAIFFPYLMRLLTGIHIKCNELAYSNIMESKLQSYTSLEEFPYIGYYEILNRHVNIDEKKYFPRFILPKKYKLLNHIGKHLLRKPKVALLDLSCDARYIAKRLIYKGYYPFFPGFERLNIPNYSEQLGLLEKSFDKVIERFELPFKTEEISEIFNRFCSPYLSNNVSPLAFKVLITGTLQKLKTRILAAKARSQNITVISLSHGDGDQLVVDEPRTGYGELTYPTYFIGYGKGGKENIQNSVYLKGLYNLPDFVPSNSNICKKIFSPSQKIKKLSEFDNPTYMYVPTTFVNYLRYGPFHSMPDKSYYEWQKKIYELFPDAIYKRHPKLFTYDVSFKTIIKRNFKDCIDMADVFIFDVLATAFNIAAATDKPIIYFDLGIRNLHPDVIPLIKERCIWVDVRDNQSLNFIRSQIHSQRDKMLINGFTRQFCIIDSHTKREDTIISVVDNILS